MKILILDWGPTKTARCISILRSLVKESYNEFSRIRSFLLGPGANSLLVLGSVTPFAFRSSGTYFSQVFGTLAKSTVGSFKNASKHIGVVPNLPEIPKGDSGFQTWAFHQNFRGQLNLLLVLGSFLLLFKTQLIPPGLDAVVCLGCGGGSRVESGWMMFLRCERDDPRNTVDGSEIRRSPVEVGRIYHYLQGFIHVR